jgi:lactoylglutathione lyase
MSRSTDYIGAVGIGVSDLERSAQFYEQALGMVRVQTLHLPHMDEVILVHPGRNAIVLMHWTDGSTRNYRDLPIKLVFYVADPKAFASRIIQAGGRITRDPAPLGEFGVVGLGLDPDGYVVELLQAPAARSA